MLCSSSVVHKCVVEAHQDGKQFRVIVVDSRPKFEGMHMYTHTHTHLHTTVLIMIELLFSVIVSEGQQLLRKLVKAGVKCSYILINAVSYIMKEVSCVRVLVLFASSWYPCTVHLILYQS